MQENMHVQYWVLLLLHLIHISSPLHLTSAQIPIMAKWDAMVWGGDGGYATREIDVLQGSSRRGKNQWALGSTQPRKAKVGLEWRSDMVTWRPRFSGLPFHLTPCGRPWGAAIRRSLQWRAAPRRWSEPWWCWRNRQGCSASRGRGGAECASWRGPQTTWMSRCGGRGGRAPWRGRGGEHVADGTTMQSLRRRSSL